MEPDILAERRAEQRHPPIANARLGMLIFVIGEVMVFVALLVGYTATRFGAKGFDAMPMLPASAAIMPVVVLLVCSSCLRFATHGLMRGDVRRYRWSMVVAAGVGLTFLALVLDMWHAASQVSMVPGHDVRSGLFYLLTGAHALHAVGGVIAVIAMALRGVRTSALEPSKPSAHAVELYWDFVSVTGMVIYAILFIVR